MSRGLGDVYKRQVLGRAETYELPQREHVNRENKKSTGSSSGILGIKLVEEEKNPVKYEN